MAQPQRPEKGLRKGGSGRGRPQSLKPCPGSDCASRPGLGRPRAQEALPRCSGHRSGPPDAAPDALQLTCSRPPVGSGAGRAETSCFLGCLFIPAPSAAARPTRPANPRPRVAEAGSPGARDGCVTAGTGESTRALGLAGPGQRRDERADRPTVLQRPADWRAARGRGGGAGGGAAARAAAAEEPAARCEAAPCRGPAGPPARACGYGGAGLEPRDPLTEAYGAEAPGCSRSPVPAGDSPPHPTLRSPAADVQLSSLRRDPEILGL